MGESSVDDNTRLTVSIGSLKHETKIRFTAKVVLVKYTEMWVSFSSISLILKWLD